MAELAETIHKKIYNNNNNNRISGRQEEKTIRSF